MVTKQLFVALLNGGILLISIGAILYESIHRLILPEPLPGKTISIVAAIGIVINAVTALLVFRNKGSDLTLKAAFIHLMSDAVVSPALVVGGIIIIYNKMVLDDPLPYPVAIVIVAFHRSLLRDSLRLSLDAVPWDRFTRCLVP
jgi:cobalt-zinc-cadmium efflux system protein